MSESTDPMSPLPDLFVVVLDDESIDAYFDDLRLCGDVQCNFKMRSEGYADDAVFDLQTGVSRWRERSVHAMQCVYRWEGATWCDTLKREEDGTRLVRIKRDWDEV